MMTILKDLAVELVGMFFAETWLTLTVLALVAVTGWSVEFAGLDRLGGGAILLFGSLVLLVASICHGAKGHAP